MSKSTYYGQVSFNANIKECIAEYCMWPSSAADVAQKGVFQIENRGY